MNNDLNNISAKRYMLIRNILDSSENKKFYNEMDALLLKKYFDKQNKMPLKNRVNIILMLFPVNNKDELVINLHKRLWHMQNI